MRKSQSGDSSARLGPARLAAYGAFTIPLSVAGLPVAIYVAPIYTDHVGLGLTMVGLAIMATRLLDIVIDPLVGRLSDSTNTRFGRRVPWIIAGVPVMMLGTWKTFMPGPDASALGLFVWLSVFYLGWAMIVVPYAAWGAELSPDYHERSRISGSRELFSVIGLLFAVTFPLFVRPADLGETSDRAMVETAAIVSDMEALGWATMALLPLLSVVLIRWVPVSNSPAQEVPFTRQLFRETFRNHPFMLLLAGTFLAGLASGMNQTTIIHYYRYRAGLGDQADVMIFYFFLAAVAGAFFWVWVGRHFAKHHVIAVSSLISLVASLAILLVPAGDVTGFTLIQLATGFAYAGPLILGASMAADVIDLDWLRSGLQRGAMFIAFWGIGKKLSEAAGVGIGLPLMEGMGFTPQTAHTDAGQWALIMVNVLLPAAFALAAIPFILAYPITERRQRVIRAALDRRFGRQARTDAHAADESEILIEIVR
jgi:Na+/melibiose symporter-like transporter